MEQGARLSGPPTHFLQTGGVPTTQLSFWQASSPLQNFSSSQPPLAGGPSWSHCTHRARSSLQKPRHLPPVPQFASVVQVAPGVGPRKHFLEQFGGVPAWHRPVEELQLSWPLQNDPSWQSPLSKHSTHLPVAMLQRNRGAVVQSPFCKHATHALRSSLHKGVGPVQL